MIALWHPANSRESRYRMQTPFCVWVRQTFGGVRIEQFFFLLNKCSVRKCVVILVNEWCLLSRFIRITWCRCRRVAHFSLFVRQIYLLARVSGGVERARGWCFQPEKDGAPFIRGFREIHSLQQDGMAGRKSAWWKGDFEVGTWNQRGVKAFECVV